VNPSEREHGAIYDCEIFVLDDKVRYSNRCRAVPSITRTCAKKTFARPPAQNALHFGNASTVCAAAGREMINTARTGTQSICASHPTELFIYCTGLGFLSHPGNTGINQPQAITLSLQG